MVCTAPTARPLSTPGRPATWSAWKCESTSSGTRVMPSPRRQSSISRGSGPVSTSTAEPSPADSTRASPWPTSQATSRQPVGGQPVTSRVNGAGLSTATRSARASPPQTTGLRRRRCRRGTASSTAPARSSPPVQPPGQGIAAPGSPAPVLAMDAIHSAGQPASHPSPSAAGIETGAAARAANPRTVAGATASSASRLHGTATRLTRAARTATTGAHTACAAPAAASTSARRPGTPLRRRASLQRGATVSRAPVARTESRKP